MCIQLADRSIKYPKCIANDVLVRVDKFIFLVNFVVLDMDQDIKVPLIFLATARVIMKLVIRFGNDEASFNISKIAKQPMANDNNCYFLDIFHEPINSCPSHMIFKGNLCADESDRVGIAMNKLRDYESIGDDSLIVGMDPCFTSNYLSSCNTIIRIYPISQSNF